MDSLKSLLDRKEYDLLLDLTKQSSDPEEIFYRITALTAQNKGKEALAELILNRPTLYKHNPGLCLKANFELRFILKQWDDAYKDIKFFEDQPYVSQEIEEQLRALPEVVRSNERASEFVRTYEPEDVIKALIESKDDYEVLAMLNYIKVKDCAIYKPYIGKVVESNRHPYVKTFALLLLIALGSSEKVKLEKNGKTFELVPSDTIPPYSGEEYNSVCRSLRDLCKDPSVYNVAKEIMDNCIIDMFPEKVYLDKNDKNTFGGLYLLALKYLQSEEDPSARLNEEKINLEDAKKREEEISSVLESSTPLKY
ncbi:MAG: hypothetical protein MJ239_03160 [Bacilli bacterium]|nr:hypothetical protein [Bacilli bacterium]